MNGCIYRYLKFYKMVSILFINKENLRTKHEINQMTGSLKFFSSQGQYLTSPQYLLCSVYTDIIYSLIKY